jgi:hypothetical protein
MFWVVLREEAGGLITFIAPIRNAGYMQRVNVRPDKILPELVSGRGTAALGGGGGAFDA